MPEYRFDRPGENARRLPLLGAAIAGSLFSAFAWWAGGGHASLETAVGPLAVGAYVLQLLHYRYHRNDRVVLEGEEIVIYDGGTPRRIPLRELSRVWQAEGLIHLQRGYDLIIVQYSLLDQEDLFERLTSSLPCNSPE